MSNTIDIYKPQFMMRMVEQLPPVHTFLKDTFFGTSHKFYTESVMFDIVKNGMTMAPFVSPRIGSTVLEREGYETKEFTPPLISPKAVLTVDDLDTRLPGESPINGYRPSRRQAELLQRDMMRLNRAITMREEWMAAMALFEGKIFVAGQGISRDVDFGFENNIVVDVEWSDFKNSDPLRDILQATDLVASFGYTPDIMIANAKTINWLMDNERVNRLFDNDAFRMGVFEPSRPRNGARRYAYLREAGLEVFVYNSTFADNDNENPDFPGIEPGDKGFVPKSYRLVPDGKVFIGSTQMPAEMLYGVVKNLRNGNRAEPRVPNVWDDPEGETRFITLKSRALPCPKDVSAWAILDVGGGA